MKVPAMTSAQAINFLRTQMVGQEGAFRKGVSSLKHTQTHILILPNNNRHSPAIKFATEFSPISPGLLRL